MVASWAGDFRMRPNEELARDEGNLGCWFARFYPGDAPALRLWPLLVLERTAIPKLVCPHAIIGLYDYGINPLREAWSSSRNW
jgi:hypothetical protein